MNKSTKLKDDSFLQKYMDVDWTNKHTKVLNLNEVTSSKNSLPSIVLTRSIVLYLISLAVTNLFLVNFQDN